MAKYMLDNQVPFVSIQIKDSICIFTKQKDGSVLIAINKNEVVFSEDQFSDLFSMLDVLRSARGAND